MALIPLQIPTADNTAITGDTNNFTCDGANLVNGGASQIVRKKAASYAVSGFIGIPAYGPLVGKSPLPQLYPPQTFYINGAPVVL